jgi:hypothetical protein
MGERSDPRTLQARDEAAAPIDEDLEDVLEDGLDKAASPEEEGELEEALEAVLGEETEEPESGETEAAIEAELESEDLTAINGEAVVEVLLRRTGVLPPETEIGTPDEAAQLPAPRREDEFVCSRCFLIKPRTQLGNVEQRVCRDCLEPPQNGHAA